MSPNGMSSGFHEIFILSSSESSDSESLLHEDIKSNGSQINNQWEAIERTLYQEPGQQVTDTKLLKECKLWRETFPHFRVKGTKIDIKQANNECDENDKSIQTLQKHIDLKKLEEKRESFKRKVVGMLVERLINKYGPDKGSVSSENFKSSVQITEIDENFKLEDYLNGSPKISANKNAETNTTNKESYFERGKITTSEPTRELELMSYTKNESTSVKDSEKNFYESWEKEIKTAKVLHKIHDGNDIKMLGSCRDDIRMKSPDRSSSDRFKPKKTSPPNTLGSTAKPFEMTKKIDKKYEGLVDKIFERKCNELETIRHCHTSASRLEMKSFQESLKNLRIGSGYDEYMKRNMMPRINKLDNNWLKGREKHLGPEGFPLKKTPNVKINNPSQKSNFHIGDSRNVLEERFLDDLKREMSLNYKRPAKRTGVIEEINLRRPKPFAPAAEKASKALSCGDLQKKNKKESKDRQLKSGLETVKSESNFKKNVKHNHLNNKGSKSKGNQNQLLPPIETGGFCNLHSEKSAAVLSNKNSLGKGVHMNYFKNTKKKQRKTYRMQANLKSTESCCWRV